MQGNNIVTLTTSLVMMFCNITLLLLVTIIEMPLKALMYNLPGPKFNTKSCPVSSMVSRADWLGNTFNRRLS